MCGMEQAHQYCNDTLLLPLAFIINNFFALGRLLRGHAASLGSRILIPRDYWCFFFWPHPSSVSFCCSSLLETDPASLCRGKEAQSQAINPDTRSALHWQGRQPAIACFLAVCQHLHTDLSRTCKVSDSAEAVMTLVITLYWVSSPFQCRKDQVYMTISCTPTSTSSLNYSGSCQAF